MRFDEKYWSKAIAEPDWYIKLHALILEAREAIKDDEQFRQFNIGIRKFFETALEENRVALASSGIDLDAERKPIDTVVIHHTSNQPGYSLSYLNAVHLLNIYLPYFINPTVKGEERLMGQPLWSGHIYGGRPVFWGYHWMMRMDGSFERLLPDEAIGWHAGNWEINRRSVAICLDNDYSEKDPSNEILSGLAAHIDKHYKWVGTERLLGHRECRQGTNCPGDTWLTSWKDKLVNYIREA
jgi:hypothetical protein